MASAAPAPGTLALGGLLLPLVLVVAGATAGSQAAVVLGIALAGGLALAGSI